MLALYEELFLLALDEEKGNLVWFARKSFAYPLAGTILAELALMKKLGLNEKLRLVLNDDKPTGDPIFDSAMEQIRSSEKFHKASYWVSRLSEEPKRIRQNIGERLVEKKVLSQDEKRFFRQELLSGTEPSAPDKFKLKNDLRASILSAGSSDIRILTLLKMIAAGDLLGLIFTLDEIETADRIIHEQLLTIALQDPVMQLVEEIGQAVSAVREDELE